MMTTTTTPPGTTTTTTIPQKPQVWQPPTPGAQGPASPQSGRAPGDTANVGKSPAPNPDITAAAAATGGTPLTQTEEQLTNQMQSISPLAMQMFYQQIVAPMMTQIQGQTQQANKQYQSAEQQIAGLPFMKGNAAAQDQLSQVPQENLGNTNLVNAYMGAAAAGPEQASQANAMTQLQSLLGQDLATRQKLADPTYAALVAQAGGLPGGAQSTTSPTYMAAQAAGASPQVLQAILGASAGASSSTGIPGLAAGIPGLGGTTSSTPTKPQPTTSLPAGQSWQWNPTTQQWYAA